MSVLTRFGGGKTFVATRWHDDIGLVDADDSEVTAVLYESGFMHWQSEKGFEYIEGNGRFPERPRPS